MTTRIAQNFNIIQKKLELVWGYMKMERYVWIKLETDFFFFKQIIEDKNTTIVLDNTHGNADVSQRFCTSFLLKVASHQTRV